MYTQELPVYIPEFAWRSANPGRHSICFHKPRISFGEHGAVWFLLWWLFLHRRLRSRQRGFARLAPDEATYAPLWPFLSAGCYPFLSGRSRKPRGLPWQAFRLQRGVSIGINSRLSLPSSLASPQRSPFPSLVTTPASDATEVEGYTLPFNHCQEENTLTIAPNIFHSLWKNLWKTLIKNPRHKAFAKRSIYLENLLRILRESELVKLEGLQKTSVEMFDKRM
jgi:hypothetical protein